jgi:hypothetical protein
MPKSNAATAGFTPAMEDNETHVYRVNERDGEFAVVNDSGNVILVCRDEPSAANYVVLLNEAFQRGYKMGYRDARDAGIRHQKS